MNAITREEKIISGENLMPITRKEMFLAKAAGQDVQTPTPITREEMFLSKISQGGGGTGGGDGGGSGGGEEWIGDGKTHLWIKIAAEGRMDVPLYFSQTVENGVTIDWGDGSATETLSGTGNKNTTHTYSSVGDYVISLDVADGCSLGLGHGSPTYCVMGKNTDNGVIYCSMLKKVEVGNGIKKITSDAFYRCYSLQSIIIPEGVTVIGQNAFTSCYSLSNVVIPEGVVYIEMQAFIYCSSIANIVIPKSLTLIHSGAFKGCNGMKFYDFTKHTRVPTLNGTDALSGIPADCEIRVPTALVDEWKAATNWSTYADYIVGV